MNRPSELNRPTGPTSPTRWDCSRAMLVLACLLLAATFFLISPRPGASYPSAVPWRDVSILKPLTGLMSLNGLLASSRGVEIKDLAFYLAAAIGLVLLGVQLLGRPPTRALSQAARSARYAQLLLGGWVVLSMLSGLWSGDPALSAGQASVYALSLCWAVALGGALDRRHVPPLLIGLLTITTLGAALAIWYYVERNPFHRASFPIGNPTTLAAALLPAILIAVALLGRGLWGLHARQTHWLGPVIGTAAALAILLVCLWLTASRGAALALAVGLATMLIFLAGRRARWLLAIAFAVTIIVAGLTVYYTSRLDVTMARGATTRFRMYAWRYATQLWSSNPLLGNGAGAYPRLAGQLAGRDRLLDPGALMAEIVDHAHNELFEVLTEIGLVGGVTFVGGMLATILVAVLLLQPRAPDPPRWLRLALVASIAALMADALVGVTQRLPGVPAIFFTLLGVLWTIARDEREADTPDTAQPQPAAHAWNPAVVSFLICLAAATGGGWLAVRNWIAVGYELAANAAYNEGRFADAHADITRAESGLLDPIQKLAARQMALDCRAALAQEAYLQCVPPVATTAPSEPQWLHAANLARETYDAALEVLQTVPAAQRTDATAAQAAEWLARLLDLAGQKDTAADWQRAANIAWQRQRLRTPFDVETLLALTRYRPTVATHLELLRDAVRFPTLNDLERYGIGEQAQMRRRWLSSLADALQQPGFAATLASFEAAVGPITPDTDLDTLIATMAPEVHRLAAATHALRGEFDAAVASAAQAVTLYEPMRPRFPLLYPTALAEQADYLLHASANNAPRAAELVSQAIAALPTIQVEKYRDMAAPFRWQLAVIHLVTGDTRAAVAVGRTMLGERADVPGVMEQVLAAQLRELEARGYAEEIVARARGGLCAEFPALCTPPASQPTSP